MLTEKEISRISEQVDNQLALLHAVTLMECFLESPSNDPFTEEYYREKMQAFVTKQKTRNNGKFI